LRYNYTKLSIRNYIPIFLMDRYVVLTRFFDYSSATVFATILDYNQVTYIFEGLENFNPFISLEVLQSDMILKVLDVDWPLAYQLYIDYKYGNHLQVV
jgi:hypothetical protein